MKKPLPKLRRAINDELKVYLATFRDDLMENFASTLLESITTSEPGILLTTLNGKPVVYVSFSDADEISGTMPAHEFVDWCSRSEPKDMKAWLPHLERIVANVKSEISRRA